jgi:proteasome lid subunit RPN8/RPN11
VPTGEETVIDWNKIFEDVKRHAQDDAPNVSCGIVFNDGSVLRSANVFEPAEARHFRFRLNLAAFREYNQDDILGMFISHPNIEGAYPSVTDGTSQPMPGKLVLIVGMCNGIANDVKLYRAQLDPRFGIHLVMADQPILSRVVIEEEKLKAAPAFFVGVADDGVAAGLDENQSDRVV